MNPPHLWFPPEDYSQSILGCYNDENAPSSLSFIRAMPILETIGLPSFKFAAQRSRLVRYDVLPNTIGVPLISPRVAALLANICPAEFQLIPCKIHTADAPIEDYSLLNVLVEISGIDHAHSSLLMFPKDNCIISVKRLRYATGAMGRHHLAREREYHPFLWVSDEVVQKFALAKFKGYEFRPPEAIHP